MKSIRINGKIVKITVETYKRIEAVAKAEKITIGKAVAFCLQRVI